MVYYKDKLVRFTGVPLNDLVECGDLTKTNSGLKQTNVPQGWARISGGRTTIRWSFHGIILI